MLFCFDTYWLILLFQCPPCILQTQCQTPCQVALLWSPHCPQKLPPLSPFPLEWEWCTQFQATVIGTSSWSNLKLVTSSLLSPYLEVLQSVCRCLIFLFLSSPLSCIMYSFVKIHITEVLDFDINILVLTMYCLQACMQGRMPFRVWLSMILETFSLDSDPWVRARNQL